jgi:hypothetical protein
MTEDEKILADAKVTAEKMGVSVADVIAVWKLMQFNRYAEEFASRIFSVDAQLELLTDAVKEVGK